MFAPLSRAFGCCARVPPQSLTYYHQSCNRPPPGSSGRLQVTVHRGIELAKRGWDDGVPHVTSGLSCSSRLYRYLVSSTNPYVELSVTGNAGNRVVHRTKVRVMAETPVRVL